MGRVRTGRGQRGLSLLEMALTLALMGVLVTVFAHQVIGISSLTSNARLDTQSSELKADVRMYLRQYASVRRIVDRMVTSELFGTASADCLKGIGKSCRQYSKLSWQQLQNKDFTMSAAGTDGSGFLYEYYGMNGPCESKDAYSCPWRVSLHSRWVCEKDTACSGLEFVGQIVGREGGKDVVLYRYNKFWNSYDLGFSAPVDYNACGDVDPKTGVFTPRDPIKDVDYADRKITCGELPERVVCDTEAEPIRGTAAGNCGDDDLIPKAGVCTLAFAPGKFINSGDKDDFRVTFSTQGENLSRLQMKCQESWTAAPGYSGPGQQGNSVYMSQVAYLPEEEEATGELGLLQQNLLPGRTEIQCTAVMVKQDQSEAGDCYASLVVNTPLGGGVPTFEDGPPRMAPTTADLPQE